MQHDSDRLHNSRERGDIPPAIGLVYVSLCLSNVQLLTLVVETRPTDCLFVRRWWLFGTRNNYRDIVDTKSTALVRSCEQIQFSSSVQLLSSSVELGGQI